MAFMSFIASSCPRAHLQESQKNLEDGVLAAVLVTNDMQKRNGHTICTRP